jgi:hypothetical protein
MFFPLLTLFFLSGPIVCLPSTAVALTDPPTPAAQTFVVCGDEPGPTVARTYVVAPKEGGYSHVFASANDDEDLPKVWIGVRLTPVPAPLAAHIGEHGVMIANVVKKGPADEAGLQQYDVIVGFAGRELKGPQDLTAAVAKAEPGQPVKLAIIRKGAKQEVEIKPAERPRESDMAMKYDEPAESFVDDAVKMYGRALTAGPDGRWIMRDLGSLRDLPGALKDFEIKLGPDRKDMRKLEDLERLLELHARDLDELESGVGDEDKDVRVEVKIQVDKDGAGTTIMRDAGGKIHVTHKDADGKESTAVYDDAEALEKADPEAYQLYERHAVHDDNGYIYIRPSGDRVRKWRKEFQVDVEKKVKEALSRAKEACERAEEQAAKGAQAADREIHKKLAEIRLRHAAEKGGAAAPEKETVVIRIDPQGAIHVAVAKDGEKREYEFKSKEDFKAAEPDLYDRVSDVLE